MTSTARTYTLDEIREIMSAAQGEPVQRPRIVEDLAPVSEGHVYLRPSQLAERWHMQETSLTHMRWRRRGPPYKKLGSAKGSPVLYRLRDVEEYEERFTVLPIRVVKKR